MQEGKQTLFAVVMRWRDDSCRKEPGSLFIKFMSPDKNAAIAFLKKERENYGQCRDYAAEWYSDDDDSNEGYDWCKCTHGNKCYGKTLCLCEIPLNMKLSENVEKLIETYAFGYK